jgi:hypothetical protein
MTDKVMEFALQAGLIKHPGSDTVGLRDFDWRGFADLIIRDCIAQCRNVSYAAMEIELDLNSPTREFDRGSKSGRKFGSMECATRLSKRYDQKIN